MQTPAQPLATISEAAQHFNVTPATIRGLIQAGEIPAVRLGPRLLRIDLDAAAKALTVLEP